MNFRIQEESHSDKRSAYIQIKSHNIYIYNAFDIKDKLKILQFRWEPSEKSWFITENIIRTAISQILYEGKQDYTGEITLPLILQCCEEREKDLEKIHFTSKSSQLQLQLQPPPLIVSPISKLVSSPPILFSFPKDINIVMKSDILYLYNSFSLKESLKKLNFRFDKDEKAWFIPLLNIRQIISDKLYSGSWFKGDITLDHLKQCITKDLENSNIPPLNPNTSVSVVRPIPINPSPPPPSPNRLRVSHYNTYLKHNQHKIKEQKDSHDNIINQKWKFEPQYGLKNTKSYTNLNWSWGPKQSSSPNSSPLLDSSDHNKKSKRSYTDAFSWSCPACTFLNESGYTFCDMCGTEAPFEEDQISLFSSLDTIEDDSSLPLSTPVLVTSQEDSNSDHVTFPVSDSKDEQSNDQSN